MSDSPAPVVTTAAAVPLRAADFILTNGSGFTGFAPANGATGATSTDAGAAPFAALASCLGISAADAADRSTDRAESTHLTNSGTGTTIWSDAQIVSAAQLDRDAGLLRHPRFADCATAQAKKDADAAFLAKYGADGVFDTEAVTRDDAPLPAGALARTSVVVLGGTANGGQAQLFYDTIYLGSGQVEAQLHLVSSVDPPARTWSAWPRPSWRPSLARGRRGVVVGAAETRSPGRARRVGGLVALIVPLVLVGCTGGSESPLGDVSTPRAEGSAPLRHRRPPRARRRRPAQARGSTCAPPTSC